MKLIIKIALNKFFRIFIIFILIFVWIFSGWPVIWQNPRIPPEISKVKAEAISYKKGSFTKPTATGSQSITGVGFQPKAVIFFYTTQTTAGNLSGSSGYGVGFATGPTSQRAVSTYSVAAGTSDTARISSESKAIIILSAVTTIGGAASLTSFDNDGFTLNWTTANTSAYIIHYIAIGGAEITNATTGTFTLTTGTGSLSVTDTGFQPDFLMFLGIGSNSASETIDAQDLFHIGFASGATAEAGLSLHSRDAQATSDTCSLQRSDNAVVLAGPAGTACNTTDALADLTSFDSNGFTLNKSDAPAANVKVHYLALKGGRHYVSVFNSPTAVGNNSITGVGFKPEGLMITSFARVANTAAVANYFFGLGGTDGINQGIISRADADGDGNPDPDVSTVTNQAFGSYTANGTVGLQATFTSFNDNGFTLNWTTVQTTARQIIYWAIAGKPTFESSAYRWFENQDSTQIGAPLTASQDQPATLTSSGQAFRLRMLIHIGASQLALNGESFKLQFAQRGTDNLCDSGFSGETYSDVTTATIIAYNNNPTPTDGSSLTPDASNDPTHGGDTIVNQTYEELNNFTNSVSAIPSGQDGKWDFSLKDNGAPTSTTYCFRVIKADNSLLNIYSTSSIPQITTASGVASISCSTNVTSTSFGNILTGSVFTSSPNVSSTISCSGTSVGCSLYIKDTGNNTNPGLYKSSSPTYLITSTDATLDGSSEGYGIQAATTTAGSGGVLILNSKYNVSGNTVGGLTLADTVLASSTLDVSNREVIVTHKASVGASALSGSYSDTITYSCIAN